MSRRLFVSVDLDELADDIAAVQERFADASGLRFTDPRQTHVTLTFLGDTDGDRIPTLVDELATLHEAIEERTVAMGFDAQAHDFTPHATIARMDHAGGKALVQERVRDDDPAVGAVHVDEVRLKESVLGSGGPTYSTVERFEL